MKFKVVTLFPENLRLSLDYGVIGKAQKEKIIEIEYINPRNYCENNKRSVDDKPYGGGPGMVIKAKPLLGAIEYAKKGVPENCPVVFLSPQGALFDQKQARVFSKLNDLILVSGRYEGIDERVINATVNAIEISIGNFVLSGGEIAASAIIDAVARLIPGTLGDELSALQDSFTESSSPNVPGINLATASIIADAAISPPLSTKFPIDISIALTVALMTLSSMPSYLPETRIKSFNFENTLACFWSNKAPCGDKKTTGQFSGTPFLAYSIAPRSGLAFITMPGPPP
jgi:tRNA (guanine-N1)-methyltransferase